MKYQFLIVTFIQLSIFFLIECRRIEKRGFFIADDTKWCGGGNIASNCSDLGRHSETDKCCREHDYCPYTFSILSPNYNGYQINSWKTLSYCECDLIFYDCLHSNPYKPGSYYIWTSYHDLKVSCFAYLPCSQDNSTNYENLSKRSNGEDRRTGTCHNGFKVTIFDGTKDYSDFMQNQITHGQKKMVKNALATNIDSFMSNEKKEAKCLKEFPDNVNNVVKSFDKRFFKESTTTTTTTTSKIEITQGTTTSTSSIFGTGLGSVGPIKILGYSFEAVHLLLIIIGLLLIVPSAVFCIWIIVRKIQRSLDKYIFIKNNVTDL